MDKLMMGAARIRANRLHRISALPGGNRHSFSQNLCAGFIDIERIRSVRRLQTLPQEMHTEHDGIGACCARYPKGRSRRNLAGRIGSSQEVAESFFVEIDNRAVVSARYRMRDAKGFMAIEKQKQSGVSDDRIASASAFHEDATPREDYLVSRCLFLRPAAGTVRAASHIEDCDERAAKQCLGLKKIRHREAIQSTSFPNCRTTVRLSTSKTSKIVTAAPDERG